MVAKRKGISKAGGKKKGYIFHFKVVPVKRSLELQNAVDSCMPAVLSGRLSLANIRKDIRKELLKEHEVQWAIREKKIKGPGHKERKVVESYYSTRNRQTDEAINRQGDW